jgi:hypothetical protein
MGNKELCRCQGDLPPVVHFLLVFASVLSLQAGGRVPSSGSCLLLYIVNWPLRLQTPEYICIVSTSTSSTGDVCTRTPSMYIFIRSTISIYFISYYFLYPGSIPPFSQGNPKLYLRVISLTDHPTSQKNPIQFRRCKRRSSYWTKWAPLKKNVCVSHRFSDRHGRPPSTKAGNDWLDGQVAW